MGTKTELTVVGRVRSTLRTLDQCPDQGDEGAPAARLDIDPQDRGALRGIDPGTRITVLTWLDRADRAVLQVHPRGNPKNPLTGVFFTRSPHRPNPIGLHEVRVVEVEADGALLVEPLEVLDDTPIIDIKKSFD
jgi:L-fuculose-phosphate aldolase